MFTEFHILEMALLAQKVGMDEIVRMVMTVVIPLLALVFWVIQQMNEGKKKPSAQQTRQQRPPRRPDDQASSLRRQIEELRQQGEFEEARNREMAAEGPTLDVKEARPARPDPTIELLLDDDPTVPDAVPVDRPRSQRPNREAREKSRAKRQDANKQPKTRERRSTRDRAEASPGPLAGQGADLGKAIALEEEKVESRLHSIFDHHLGSLGGIHNENAYEQKVTDNALAKELASQLAQPQGVRQAIILSEILNRPEDRW